MKTLCIAIYYLSVRYKILYKNMMWWQQKMQHHQLVAAIEISIQPTE